MPKAKSKKKVKEKIRTYCSWCYKNRYHELKKTSRVSRNYYLCKECLNLTLKCKACDNMARGTLKSDEMFCSIHNGTIASFKRLKQKINNIGEYEQLFERDGRNFAKYTKFAAFTLGGALIIAPVAFSSAPVIGGALGVKVLGLSGAAATKAGLAKIGLGSIASGGFGIKGGITIITAAGACLGAAEGAIVANAYYGSINNFSIKRVQKRVQKGVGKKIIVINGWLSEKDDNINDWKKGLLEKYPNNPWYHLTWESKRLYDIGKAISVNSLSKLVKYFTVEAAKKSSKSVTLGTIDAVLTTLGLARNPWHVAMVKATQTGILLAEILSRVKGNEQYVLMGNSLGARVVYSTLQTLSSSDFKRISEVHLLGGAVGREPKKDWESATKIVRGKIYNYLSENDDILRYAYQGGTLGRSKPIGLYGIGLDNDKVEDIDVTSYVDGHMKYKQNLKEFIK